MQQLRKDICPVVKLLLDRGADVSEKGKLDERSHLYWAATIRLHRDSAIATRAWSSDGA